MSFITKRERVFNEYDLCDLPSRNEGKLKAYASCTDARAWSHFCSDKTEHLVDVIKRNNELCRPKYVPTEAIIRTLMVGKNAEIARLKRKIGEFEQMLCAYEDLELTCEQKCEIANAHQMIKAANKELDEMSLDLDLSGFTEESEAFETGKSKFEETSRQIKFATSICSPITESQGEQAGPMYGNDASTSAHDSRLDEMKDDLIAKDAKLNAMQNTIAVMENDVCQPYCIYAHIYTALEKIFGILCQNAKYKQYLDLLSAGKNTRNLDITGKLLFKLKVLEKFAMALVAPCSETCADECKCDNSTIIARVETTLALTPAFRRPIDSGRSNLIADIMGNEDVKDILQDAESVYQDDDDICLDNFNINAENLSRLKNLQENYNDLMQCYEELKYEKIKLQLKCNQYDDQEKELRELQIQLRNYNMLWNEKEHYRKRSEDLDSLKEKYLILTDETSNIENQLKAEAEINNSKTNLVSELRNQNIKLERKLNDCIIACEKEKSALQCKLKEAECKVMCQEQEIKCLTRQINNLLEHEQISGSSQPSPLDLINEMESLKDQIVNLKNALLSSEEDKNQLQSDFENQLKHVNELKIEIMDLKNMYDKSQQSSFFDNYEEDYHAMADKLINENKKLSQTIEEKHSAIENLMQVIKNKSQEIDNLRDVIETKSGENENMLQKISHLNEQYRGSFDALNSEKKDIESSLRMARKESENLLEKVKSYDELIHSKEDALSKALQSHENEKKKLRKSLADSINENKQLQNELKDIEHKNESLIQNIQQLKDVNKYAEHEKCSLLASFDKARTESKITLEDQLSLIRNLEEELESLRQSNRKLSAEKDLLQNELENTQSDLQRATTSIELTKKESIDLREKLMDTENLKENFIELSNELKKYKIDNNFLHNELLEKNKKNYDMLKKLETLESGNAQLARDCASLADIQRELMNMTKAFDELLSKKTNLQNDLNSKSKEISNLYNDLQDKLGENEKLVETVMLLQQQLQKCQTDYNSMESENSATKMYLDKAERHSTVLLNDNSKLENELANLKRLNFELLSEKEGLQKNIGSLQNSYDSLKTENDKIIEQNEIFTAQCDDLETSFTDVRNQIINSSRTPRELLLDVQNEVENLKKDKITNQQKMRDLLDRIDESDNYITSLKEEISERDNRIAVLQNHINNLEDEMRKLHDSLDDVVNVGERIRDHSMQKIDQSLKQMEAHHSRATHNIQLEVAKLRNRNMKLEENISSSEMEKKESILDNRKISSQLDKMISDRETILREIKHFDQNVDAELSPESPIEEVLASLENIKKSIAAKESKSSLLEQTLQKIQSSSQLVLGKAEEAKRLAEKEKEKIFYEKEEAVKARIKLEQEIKSMEELKKGLENELSHDKDIINDLESEILNQKLIIDKINRSRQDYINKLEEETKALQKLYKDAMSNLAAMQEKEAELSRENDDNLIVLEKTKASLNEKCSEINDLQEQINNLTNKTFNSVSIQCKLSNNNKNISAQTENQYKQENIDNFVTTNNIYETVDKIPRYETSKPKVDKTINKVNNSSPRNKSEGRNEYQVLTANVDRDDIELVKNKYFNYKMNRLSPGRLEQHSIGSLVDTMDPSTDQIPSLKYHTNLEEALPSYKNTLSENNNIKDDDDITFFDSMSGKDIDNVDSDLFILYTDKENNHDDLSTVQKNKQREMHKKHPETKNYQPKNKDTHVADTTNAFTTLRKENTNDRKKPKLHIDLARVMTENTSAETSDDDKISIKSLDSDAYLTPKRVSQIQIHEDPVQNEYIMKTPSLPNIFSSDELNPISPKRTEAKNQLLVNHQAMKPNFKSKKRKSTDKRTVSSAEQKRRSSDNHYKQSHKKTQSQKALQSYGSESKGIVQNKTNVIDDNSAPDNGSDNNFAYKYMLESVGHEVGRGTLEVINSSRYKNKSEEALSTFSLTDIIGSNLPSHEEDQLLSNTKSSKTFVDRGVLVKTDNVIEYENQIRSLKKQLEAVDKDCKTKIEAIKLQYDSNIKSIINEHNHGVNSIQSLHEDTLQDFIKLHENEVENLRTMSIEAMRKVEKLQKENQTLKNKFQDYGAEPEREEEPVRMSSLDLQRRRQSRIDTKTLTTTNVEAFNVRPKSRSNGPCTCSLDTNVSDTIRNIFQQVDADQRKIAENSYLKYIANKILNSQVESLDAQELSFLHLKVCRNWKVKLCKEDALQKRIDLLQNELLSKQRNAQINIAELDKKVAEERRRLQEVREAVCGSRDPSPDLHYTLHGPPTPPPTAGRDLECHCNARPKSGLKERKSAGDLGQVLPGLSTGLKQKRVRQENNRVGLAKLAVEDRKEKRNLSEETPIRLRRRRSQDRHMRFNSKR